MKSLDMSKIVYPVGRITQNGVSLLGTCCLLSKTGHFVTASHVTNNDDRNLVIIINKIRTFNDYQDTTDMSVKYVGVKIHATDPFSDLCILKAEFTTDIHMEMNIGTADECKPGDTVAILGYPHADQGRMVLTQQITQIGAKVLIGSEGIKTKHMILNVQSRPGQSGGPIFNLDNMSLVGILIPELFIIK